jgi:hypothetical protein
MTRRLTAQFLVDRIQFPWVIGLISLGVFALGAIYQGPILVSSSHAYFNYLADAFLHHQLYLRLLPTDVHDLVLYQNRYFLYWPPFPAVFLMPFVALFGIGFSDITFTFILGAINMALLAVLLQQISRRGLIFLTPAQRVLLLIFFAFGTVYFPVVLRGRVWFTAQIIGIFFVVLTYLAAVGLSEKRAFFWTGMALACAFLTRNNLLFVGIWPACYLLKENYPRGWRKLIGYSIIGLAPLVVAGLGFMLYNWVRFGSPLNVGLAYHLMDPFFRADFNKYGAFNIHYIPINLYYQYLAYPLPIRPETWQGGSLFLLSPLFLAAFWAFRAGEARWSLWALLASILLTNIPILLLMGTGWVQYGPRYTLDFSIPLLFLTAMGIQKWPLSRVAILVFFSIAQYLPGVFTPFP